MMRSFLFLFVLLTSLARAADPNPTEVKLRDSLRNTMRQLRTAQGERDTLQAEKTQLEQEKQTLAGQVEKLTKQAAADQDAAVLKTTTLEAQINRQAVAIKETQESLDKWKAAHAQVSAVAATKETQRAQSAQRAIELQRRIDDQQAKNLAMYKIAAEILGRFENFGLGTAVAAREPFIGAMRVRLEKLVQEYQDKLQEQRLKPEVAKPALEKPAPPAKPAPRPANKSERKNA